MNLERGQGRVTLLRPHSPRTGTRPTADEGPGARGRHYLSQSSLRGTFIPVCDVVCRYFSSNPYFVVSLLSPFVFFVITILSHST